MRINPENIDQEMLVDAIAGSQEFMDDTAPPSQSQQFFAGMFLIFDALSSISLRCFLLLKIILSGLFLFGVGLPSRNNNLISGS
jgi:hypothetical protein